MIYDSPISVLVPDEEEDEWSGDMIGSRVREVVAMREGPGRSLGAVSDDVDRMAKGGTPLAGDIRVAIQCQMA